MARRLASRSADSSAASPVMKLPIADFDRTLVVDPGERSGWVRCCIASDGTIQEATIRQGVATVRDLGEALHRALVEEQRIDTVVFETWRLRADKARKMVGNE